MAHLVAAPDKFKGTASAPEVAAAAAAGARQAGWTCAQVPMADGGEGLLEVAGGRPERSMVSGPDGAPVEAAWSYRLDQGTTVVEMAQAAGLVLAGGGRATTRCGPPPPGWASSCWRRCKPAPGGW